MTLDLSSRHAGIWIAHVYGRCHSHSLSLQSSIWPQGLSTKQKRKQQVVTCANSSREMPPLPSLSILLNQSPPVAFRSMTRHFMTNLWKTNARGSDRRTCRGISLCLHEAAGGWCLGRHGGIPVRDHDEATRFLSICHNQIKQSCHQPLGVTHCSTTLARLPTCVFVSLVQKK